MYTYIRVLLISHSQMMMRRFRYSTTYLKVTNIPISTTLLNTPDCLENILPLYYEPNQGQYAPFDSQFYMILKSPNVRTKIYNYVKKEIQIEDSYMESTCDARYLLFANRRRGKEGGTCWANVHLIDKSEGNIVFTWNSSCHAYALSKDSRLFAFLKNDEIELWNFIRPQEAVFKYPLNLGTVLDVDKGMEELSLNSLMRKDIKLVLSESCHLMRYVALTMDNDVVLWKIQDQHIQLLKVFKMPSGNIDQLKFVNNEQWLVIINKENFAVYEIANDKLSIFQKMCNKKINVGDVTALSSDGKLLATCDGYLVHFYTLCDGQIIGTEDLNFEPSGLCFSHHGHLLAGWGFSDLEVRVWKIKYHADKLLLIPIWKHPR